MIELLIERFVFTQCDRKRRAQRHSFGTKQREFLPHALNHGLEVIAQLIADIVGDVRTRKVIVPHESANRGCVAVRLNLDQLIDSVRERGHAGRTIAHSVFGGVEEQLERQFFTLAAHELLHRRIETRDAQLSDLGGLLERQIGWIELNQNLLPPRRPVPDVSR